LAGLRHRPLVLGEANSPSIEARPPGSGVSMLLKASSTAGVGCGATQPQRGAAPRAPTSDSRRADRLHAAAAKVGSWMLELLPLPPLKLLLTKPVAMQACAHENLPRE